GRRCQEHHVHTAIYHLLIGVQSDEALIGRDFDLIRMFGLEISEARLQRTFESIAHGSKYNIVVRSESFICGSRTAPAATDQSDAESPVKLYLSRGSRFGGSATGEDRGRCGQCPAEGCGRFKKFAAVWELIG